MDITKEKMDKIVWKEMKSEQGKTFEVGFLESETKSDEANLACANLSGFHIDVNWPVGDASWKYFKEGDKEFDVAAIHRYTLHRYSGPTYDYILEFSNDKHYNYAFCDEGGDIYTCNTFRNGDHFVRYNSDKPTIVAISGK